MITVVITCLNESVELALTIQSIKDTAPQASIVVIDDASQKPLTVPAGVKLVRNEHRCGVGASRHLGIQLAETPYVLLTDSHVRFAPGWYENALTRLESSENTLWSGQCLGMVIHKDALKPDGIYNSGTINFFGTDRKGKTQIFESIWADDVPDKDDYEVGSCLGACYAMNRNYYLKLGGLEYLRHWGGDEQTLSLIYWLSGGSVRHCKSVKIHHKFWNKIRQPFKIETSLPIYNKLFCILTLLPKDKADLLISKFPKSDDLLKAKTMIWRDWNLISSRRERLRGLFVVPFEQFLEKFQIPFPKL